MAHITHMTRPTLLAALWGGSFLFMRYAVPAFGAMPLIWLRVAIAAACLLPLLWWRGQVGLLWQRAGAMLVAGVPSLVTATGSQLMATLVLLPLAYRYWPAVMPDFTAWLAVIGLGVGCTALAFVLFFRLLAEVGAARAVTVTFLIPVFGVLWGSLFLGETVSTPMLLGGAVIVLGTALATGAIRLPAR